MQAPWRMPGADPADFFNYGLNINTWKEYVGRIHQFRLEFTMQKKIQTYESSNDTPALDPDLPPELAAAVAQGRQQVLLQAQCEQGTFCCDLALINITSLLYAFYMQTSSFRQHTDTLTHRSHVDEVDRKHVGHCR